MANLKKKDFRYEEHSRQNAMTWFLVPKLVQNIFIFLKMLPVMKSKDTFCVPFRLNTNNLKLFRLND